MTNMGALAGELRDKPIYEVVRSIHAAGGTGTLEVQLGDQKRRLYFQEGDLYLGSAHPLARHVGELARRLGPGPQKAAPSRAEFLDLVQRIANVVGEWRIGTYRFDPDPASLPPDRVGPLPTERLVMSSSTVGLQEADLLARVGGAAGQVAARAAFREPDRLGLSAEEEQLIERLAQPAGVEKVIAEAGAPRVDTLRRLAQLKVTGRIRTLGKDGSGPKVLPPYAAGDGELAQRLHQRFAQRLRDEAVVMTAEEYRKQIGELFARVGGLGAYEVLDLDPAASSEVIEARFEKLAMFVHPENETRFRLQGIRPILELLLERATQAYLTLADPDRRLAYDQSEGITPGGGAPTGARREEEQRTVARRYFEEGLAMATRGDFHYAIEMLELATTTDPRAEYLLALARAQSKNPMWLERAIASCRAALELDPQNAEARLQLGQLFEAAGDTGRARVQYGAVARDSPLFAQAQAKLRALEQPAPRPKAAGGGLFDRLFGRRE